MSLHCRLLQGDHNRRNDKDNTGWQQHSVRGFLAGVVRKKLKLKLNSKKIDGTRVYRIDSGHGIGATSKPSKRRAA